MPLSVLAAMTAHIVRADEIAAVLVTFDPADLHRHRPAAMRAVAKAGEEIGERIALAPGPAGVAARGLHPQEQILVDGGREIIGDRLAIRHAPAVNDTMRLERPDDVRPMQQRLDDALIPTVLALEGGNVIRIQLAGNRRRAEPACRHLLEATASIERLG